MPKMKTLKSGAKRYKVTETVIITLRKAGIGDLLANKSASRKRKLFKTTEIAASQVDLVSKELPYKKYSR